MSAASGSSLNLLAYCPAVPPEEQPRIISFQQISSMLDKLMGKPVLDSQERAYKLKAEEASICPVQTVGQQPLKPVLAGEEAQTCVKTGYIDGDDVFVTKVAGGGGKFAGNTGLMMVFSQRTLRLQCILQDEGVLTELRTAAASALASSLFAPKEVSLIGLAGASVQALWQLRLLTYVTPCRQVLLLTRSRASAEKFVEQLRTSACALDREWSVQIADAASDFARCQLIHTVTTSRKPLLGLADVARNHGVHITCVGADAPGKKELDLALISSADLRVCDNLGQSTYRGEFQGFEGDVVEISAVLNAGDAERKQFVRRDAGDARLTIFDTSGVATQDVAIAKLVSQSLSRL